MIQNKVLFIGLVWPEPTSSAAGKRILQLVAFFLNRGDEVIFCSAAAKSESSFCFEQAQQSLFKHVQEVSIQLNHPSFNEFLKELNPDIVVYDRFVSEEQFGWRVMQECPNAIQILDTEDLHFLRFAREKAFKKKAEIDLHNEITIREIASILRCDLSLMISEFERDLLKTEFSISPKLIYYLPFMENQPQEERQKAKDFSERKDFVFIGNFLHEPNWQTVLELKKNIWPAIKAKLPKAKLNIYGAYPSHKVWDLHNEKEGFWIHGKAENAKNVVSEARILLAPIPFGAGQKGKFIDAMQAGTPIATNSIGGEGMFDHAIPGIVEDDEDLFVSKTIELYQNESLWQNAREIGFQILNKQFDKNLFQEEFNKKIIQLQSNLSHHRKENFIGQILQHNTANALKYMSLWIESKNSK